MEQRLAADSPAARGAIPWALALAAIVGFARGGIGQSEERAKADLEGARAAIEKWVETRSVLSKERRDWALGREMLTGRVALLEREIEGLRARIRETEGSIAEADEKREALVRERDALKGSAEALEPILSDLEARTRALLRRLPDPIRDRVRPLSQHLPDGAESKKRALSQRFQYVVGILNEVNKFNREITVTSEVRTLGDGTTAEVTAIYLGIARAYYVTGDARAAGIGTGTAEGWAWTPSDESAARIAEAVAILKNEKVAAFVRLPVRIE
jgi:hypothetical protein